MVTPRAPAFAVLAAAALFWGCQRRGESEAIQPADMVPRVYDDRAVSPTNPATPSSTANPSPPTASAPSESSPANGQSVGSGVPQSGAVQSSAAHERLGGEYGARNTGAGANSSAGGNAGTTTTIGGAPPARERAVR